MTTDAITRDTVGLLLAHHRAMRGLAYLLLLAACEGGSSGPDLTGEPEEPNFPNELLRNGGFEILDGDVPADWRLIDDNPGGNIAVVTEPVIFGDRALQFQIEAGDGREFFIIQNGIAGNALTPGRSYVLTGAFHFDHLGDIAFMKGVRGSSGGAETNFDDFAEVSMIPTKVNEWQAFRFDFTLPADITLPESWEVVIDVLKFTGEPLVVTIDGVSLHQR